MSRFSLLAITGVNAGPCRPSSSVIPSGLETATTTIEVAEPTTTLPSTLTTETSITVQDTTTTEAATTEAATTTEAAATTAETTTALATTSAAPVPGPVRNHECEDLVSPYMAPNGASYNFACNAAPDFYFPVDVFDVTSFEQCLVQCSLSSECRGVFWTQADFYCGAFSSDSGTSSFVGGDVAYKVEV